MRRLCFCLLGKPVMAESSRIGTAVASLVLFEASTFIKVLRIDVGSSIDIVVYANFRCKYHYYCSLQVFRSIENRASRRNRCYCIHRFHLIKIFPMPNAWKRMTIRVYTASILLSQGTFGARRVSISNNRRPRAQGCAYH